jgi:indole-3-glycerol phosphate synthase
MKAETQGRDVLGEILVATAGRVARLAAERGALERAAARAPDAPAFVRVFDGPDLAVIAEVKKRSPSAGAIRADADAVDLAERYAAAGAAAISVLTEPELFGGSLDDLARVAAAVRLPVLRKDFIVDAVQLFEARAARASAVLLIARALAPERLGALAAAARHIGLATLVEVHSDAELAACLAAAPTAVGVNARDLATLAMDREAALARLARVPPGIPAVAESGVRALGDVERAAAAGADAVLVGTAAAGAADPGAVVRALTGVARRRVRNLV